MYITNSISLRSQTRKDQIHQESMKSVRNVYLHQTLRDKYPIVGIDILLPYWNSYLIHGDFHILQAPLGVVCYLLRAKQSVLLGVVCYLLKAKESVLSQSVRL